MVVIDKKNLPIGIFDSGIGGLTVAHAVAKLLPNENILYFGDTAHLPYGDKSAVTIQAYSIKICNVLLAHRCKVILIACHSASAAAYELIKEYVGNRATVINVIDPMVDHLRNNFEGKKVGLIGTNQTVFSKVYDDKITALNKNIAFKSLATPLLVPMIEEGFFKKQISHDIIREYLKDPKISDIDALILGCTHYPLIKESISAYYNNKTIVLDSATMVAKKLLSYLEKENEMNESNKPSYKFLVSDLTKSFQASARLFFDADVKLEQYVFDEKS